MSQITAPRCGWQDSSSLVVVLNKIGQMHWSTSDDGMDVLQLFHFSLKRSLLKGNTDLGCRHWYCMLYFTLKMSSARQNDWINPFSCCFLSGIFRGPVLIEQFAVISYLHACITVIFFPLFSVCIRVSSVVINPSLVQSMGFQIPWLSCRRWGRSQREWWTQR